MCLCNWRRELLNSYIPHLGDAVHTITTYTGLAGLVTSMEWAYGITTTPERFKLLQERTIPSLAKAGFDRPHLFVDMKEDAKIPSDILSYPLTIRGANIGIVGNWMLAIWELLVRYPHADRYAIFQDDFIIYPNTRKYLEKIEYPKDGYLNLYTFPENEKLASGRKGFYRSNQKGRGAVALVFDREAAVKIAASEHMANKPKCPRKGKVSVDGGIVETFKKARMYEYVHYPSLVQHVGEKSSMGNRKHPTSQSFKGENFDAMGLLKNVEKGEPLQVEVEPLPMPTEEPKESLPDPTKIIAIVGTCDLTPQSKLLQEIARNNVGARWWVVPADDGVTVPPGTGVFGGRSYADYKRFLDGTCVLYCSDTLVNNLCLINANKLGIPVVRVTDSQGDSQPRWAAFVDRTVTLDELTYEAFVKAHE